MTLNVLWLGYHSSLFAKSKSHTGATASVIRKPTALPIYKLKDIYLTTSTPKKNCSKSYVNFLKLLANEAFERLKTHKLV